VRRADVDALFGFGIEPSAQYSTAWEHQGMRAVAIDDGQLKIAVEWGG